MYHLYSYWCLSLLVGEGDLPTAGEVIFRVRDVFGVDIPRTSMHRILHDLQAAGIARRYERGARLVVWGVNHD